MKKKIFLIISSVIQALCGVYYLANANSVAQTMMKTANIENLSEELIKGIIILSVIQIVLSIIVFIIAKTDKIIKNKGKLITISIISYIISLNNIGKLLSIISFLIFVSLKREKNEDYPEKIGEKIPKLEYQKSTKKEIILGIVLIVLFCTFFFSSRILKIELNYTTKVLLNIFYYIVMSILSILCFKERIINGIIKFKENVKKYIRYIFSNIGIMYILVIIYGVIYYLITHNAINDNENQKLIFSLPIWLLIPTSILFAPIIEEIIFRGLFRFLVKNKKLFIIISSIVFGLAHTILEPSATNIIFMSIPYAIIGGTFARMYVKTNNITVNITSHAFINLFSLIFSYSKFIY